MCFPLPRALAGWPGWHSSVLTTILVNTKACPHFSHYNNTQHSSQQISALFNQARGEGLVSIHQYSIVCYVVSWNLQDLNI